MVKSWFRNFTETELRKIPGRICAPLMQDAIQRTNYTIFPIWATARPRKEFRKNALIKQNFANILFE
jgi:hypothetical protein